MEQHYRVVIIGAGIAGLSCAKYLIENNIDDFVIVEAHDQIGGRCQTIQVCKYLTIRDRETKNETRFVILVEHPIELGAESLNGEISNNPLYQLAEQSHLLDIDDSKIL
jgi:thioredoxin reductase